jgi:hypothetical protein
MIAAFTVPGASAFAVTPISRWMNRAPNGFSPVDLDQSGRIERIVRLCLEAIRQTPVRLAPFPRK